MRRLRVEAARRERRVGARLLERRHALCAEGESVLRNAWHIDRGYENMPAKLASVGAQITSEEVDSEAGRIERTYE